MGKFATVSLACFLGLASAISQADEEAPLTHRLLRQTPQGVEEKLVTEEEYEQHMQDATERERTATSQDSDDPFGRAARRRHGFMGQAGLDADRNSSPGNFTIITNGDHPSILLDTRNGKTWRLVSKDGGMDWFEMKKHPWRKPAKYKGEGANAAPGRQPSIEAIPYDPNRQSSSMPAPIVYSQQQLPASPFGPDATCLRPDYDPQARDSVPLGFVDLGTTVKELEAEVKALKKKLEDAEKQLSKQSNRAKTYPIDPSVPVDPSRYAPTPSVPKPAPSNQKAN